MAAGNRWAPIAVLSAGAVHRLAGGKFIEAGINLRGEEAAVGQARDVDVDQCRYRDARVPGPEALVRGISAEQFQLALIDA
jgi:hypothetical protein